MRILIKLWVQLGGGIHTSMVSVCLEDLETLNKKGIDIDVISNTAGNVYVGRSCFPPHAAPLIAPAGMSDTVSVAVAPPN